ncbi:MAG: hypothetical protein ACE5D0_02955 [Fidelibacterota bacterium]
MTQIWDDLKKNMKEWSSVAVEKAEEVSKIAVAKTEELTKISKIKIEIHQLQRDKAKTFENLGRLVAYHAKEENVVNFTGNKEFYGSLQKLEEIQEKISRKEKEIEKVKEILDIEEEVIDAISTETEKEETSMENNGSDQELDEATPESDSEKN